MERSCLASVPGAVISTDSGWDTRSPDIIWGGESPSPTLQSDMFWIKEEPSAELNTEVNSLGILQTCKSAAESHWLVRE